MDILELDTKVAESMISVFGEKIFKYRTYERSETTSVTLNDNAILKCYCFDGTVKIELGAKMFILERDNYWRIETK